MVRKDSMEGRMSQTSEMNPPSKGHSVSDLFRAYMHEFEFYEHMTVPEKAILCVALERYYQQDRRWTRQEDTSERRIAWFNTVHWIMNGDKDDES